MTTLLDKKRSIVANVQKPEEATLIRCFRASVRSRPSSRSTLAR